MLIGNMLLFTLRNEVLHPMPMLTNYHTHTVRCGHARGSERDYIESAIAAGLKVLGFADHSPYYFPGDYYSFYRMRPEQTADYVHTIEALREEYRDRIQILIGFEAEYYPEYFDKFLEIVEPFDYDYLVLGQHYIDNEIGAHFSQNQADEETWKKYVDQTITGLRTGRFSYFAHPDLLNFVGDPAAYRKHALRLCEAAKELDIPIELNFLGMREKRKYPREDFWVIGGEVGNKIIFGADAHSPDVIFDAASYATAEEWVERFGLKRVDYITLRDPKHPTV
jgi:histidinol-phosphatase (PHP family)